uniref:Uncharacterized protein n=1 Tax=Florenciella parvula TaxID=236787 RepID=A0A7S2FHQ9_9STRA|mmetsp:Transcript_16440/g.34330  ORF Transcript_16440/g.34330 Transcript_16440/m.34330 type:complete len:201 (+) Transcript_16440:86-688(+)|eukprot:CAMPEP_0182550504 /NCGR_PEP_ID=MMETSP1323-20130603/41683_1 /TAXON_ID=236787 /ORGANISM="Florenciella parvula, Strain RCC1693" /LENGTH=200 /DNA_ID=CAMNT_0024762041 /DNA_START=79 /DNA_END=681 /DNA_ORIENTATION=-
MAATPRETDTAGTLALTSPQHSLLVSPRSAWKRCMQDAEDIDAKTACTALLNCVVACGSKVTEDDSFDKLRELMDALSQETLNEALNFDPKGDKEALAKLSGTPLFLAAKLNLDGVAEVLIEHGASMVHKWKGVTPLQIAMTKKSDAVMVVFEAQIRSLEEGPNSDLAANFADAADQPSSASKRRAGAQGGSSSKKRQRS